MEFNFIAFIGNLLACFVCGYLIGYERERTGKSAGISTLTLVMSGAMVFTYISSIVDVNSSSRIAAQIVTGVGFLGAGIIMREKNGVVRNLTTAANIWFTAAIGMLIGYGQILAAIVTTAFVILVIRIPRVAQHKIERRKK